MNGSRVVRAAWLSPRAGGRGHDGSFRCRLDTPRFREYLDWGRDYLLVVDPDTATDVERVRHEIN